MEASWLWLRRLTRWWSVPCTSAFNGWFGEGCAVVFLVGVWFLLEEVCVRIVKGIRLVCTVSLGGLALDGVACMFPSTSILMDLRLTRGSLGGGAGEPGGCVFGTGSHLRPEWTHMMSRGEGL